MIQKNIEKIKLRASIIRSILIVIFIIGVIIVFAGLLASMFLFLTSPEKFSAVKGNMNWAMRYAVTDTSYVSIYVPYKILQPLDSTLFSAKNGFITYLISTLFSLSLILYVFKQILNILKSIEQDVTPFIMNNAKNLKKVAFITITYSVVIDFLASILCWIFVTKIFSLELTNIHLSGVLVGGLIFIIAEIFQYGVYLQNEYDTTL